jgi:tripartite ATP-independent transporter DctM subunit
VITYFLIGWLVMLLLGMPVAFSIGAISFAFLWFEGGTMTSMPQRMFASLDSFPLLAVPTFILAGEVMNSGGVTRRIVDFARVWLGHITGGLGHVNVMANVIVSGMSGSALAEAAGVGSVMIQAMKDDGFPAKFAGALTASASIIGPLIPPSIPFVIYAVMASVSAGKLLLAGFVPGILTAIALMIYVYYISNKKGYPKRPPTTWLEKWTATRIAFLALLTPVIIIYGIVGGIFTPTEAAAVTVIYALAISLFVYLDLKWREIPEVFRKAARTTAIVGIIISAANLLSYILTRERIPQILTESMLSISTNPWVILAVINALLLLLGCVMDGMAIMILTVPVLLPVTIALGIDPVHFGVILVMNLMIGLLTPPFGMALFVVAKVGKIPFEELAHGIWPFIWPIFIVLLIVTYCPALIMSVPNYLLGP